MMDPILSAAGRWTGTPYGHPRTRMDGSVIDCSTLTAHVLDSVYGPITSAQWADLVIADGKRPWSPIELARTLWGNELTEPGVARWHLLQGWRTIPTSGHAMLAWGAGGGHLIVLEAQRAHGVQWRGATTPAEYPLDLARAPSVLWPDLQRAYPAGLRLVVLGGVPLVPG